MRLKLKFYADSVVALLYRTRQVLPQPEYEQAKLKKYLQKFMQLILPQAI